MTIAFTVIVAVVALLALAGWTATLAVIARSATRHAQAWSILQQVDAAMDDRIRAAVGRIAAAPRIAPPPTGEADAAAARATWEKLSKTFDLPPLTEAPDPAAVAVDGD